MSAKIMKLKHALVDRVSGARKTKTLPDLYVSVLIAFSHYRWYTLRLEEFLGGGTAYQDT